MLTFLSADIKQRDLPLGWYVPKNVPWYLVEPVALDWLPRDWDYGPSGSSDNAVDDTSYEQSDMVSSKKRKAVNRDAGKIEFQVFAMEEYLSLIVLQNANGSASQRSKQRSAVQRSSRRSTAYPPLTSIPGSPSTLRRCGATTT